MLWTPNQQFHPWPFDKEAELETTIAEVKAALFGESRIDLDVKKLIGERGKTQNIPDGYFLRCESEVLGPDICGRSCGSRQVAGEAHTGKNFQPPPSATAPASAFRKLHFRNERKKKDRIH